MAQKSKAEKRSSRLAQTIGRRESLDDMSPGDQKLVAGQHLSNGSSKAK